MGSEAQWFTIDDGVKIDEVEGLYVQRSFKKTMEDIWDSTICSFFDFSIIFGLFLDGTACYVVWGEVWGNLFYFIVISFILSFLYTVFKCFFFYFFNISYQNWIIL